jgi:3,4-dihydroxy 2-butanone 4-phosphate synthase/GTP cyclohydrolase II
VTRTRPAAPSAVAASLAAVDRALAEVAAGRPVVLVDDDGGTGEVRGHLVLAAETATPELVAFLVRHTSGFLCVALPDADADRLDLPAMTAPGRGLRDTAFTVTVDAAEGISTGISAVDRARTVRLLAEPGTVAADLRRPGHVVPVRARDGGVLRRPGTAEAVVDLSRLAGLRPVGVAAGLVDDDGALTGPAGIEDFCTAHGLAAVRTADLVASRRVRERQVTALAEARIPTRHGVFRAVGFEDLHTGAEHVALVLGDPSGAADVLVHVHTECLAGDVFGSLGCRCGDRLDAALAAVAREGRGVVLYLRPDEAGGGTVLPAQHPRRRAGLASQVLADLGVRAVRLLDEDPADARELDGSGIAVRRRVRPVAVLPAVVGVPPVAIEAVG